MSSAEAAIVRVERDQSERTGYVGAVSGLAEGIARRRDGAPMAGTKAMAAARKARLTKRRRVPPDETRTENERTRPAARTQLQGRRQHYSSPMEGRNCQDQMNRPTRTESEAIVE